MSIQKRGFKSEGSGIKIQEQDCITTYAALGSFEHVLILAFFIENSCLIINLMPSNVVSREKPVSIFHPSLYLRFFLRLQLACSVFAISRFFHFLIETCYPVSRLKFEN